MIPIININIYKRDYFVRMKPSTSPIQDFRSPSPSKKISYQVALRVPRTFSVGTSGCNQEMSGI